MMKSIGAVALGWSLLLLGVVGLFLPLLPGIPLVIAALLILSRRQEWARRLLHDARGWLARWRRHSARGVEVTELTSRGVQMKEKDHFTKDHESSDPKFFYFVLIFLAVLIAGGIAIAFSF